MACMRASRLAMSNDWITISSGTGRTPAHRQEHVSHEARHVLEDSALAQLRSGRPATSHFTHRSSSLKLTAETSDVLLQRATSPEMGHSQTFKTFVTKIIFTKRIDSLVPQAQRQQEISGREMTWREVEEAVTGGTNPLAQVLCVGQGGAEAHNADGRVPLVADVPHSGRNHLHIVAAAV